MRPKPRGLGEEYAAQFDDRSGVEAYVHRPPFTADAVALLVELAGGASGRIPDLGCGAARRDVSLTLPPVDTRLHRLHRLPEGFSLDRMDRGAALAFDEAVGRPVAPYAPDGMLTVGVTTSVVWGRTS